MVLVAPGVEVGVAEDQRLAGRQRVADGGVAEGAVLDLDRDRVGHRLAGQDDPVVVIDTLVIEIAGP